jgi:hypothetical protein
VGCIVIEVRSDGRNLTLVVAVVFDMAHIDRLSEARRLIEVTQIRPEMVVLVDVLLVTLEGSMVALVESNQRREETDIGQREPILLSSVVVRRSGRDSSHP